MMTLKLLPLVVLGQLQVQRVLWVLYRHLAFLALARQV